MKLVIDIPEKTFKYYVTLANKGEQIGNLERIILDGTPLPEHHGRLIDADALLQKHRDIDAYPFPSITIQNAPTIIEGSDSE